MNIREFLQDRLFGRLVELTITGTLVRICQGRKSPEYELPKTFQGFNFLNHTEEMAGWLQAILQEEKIRIRRCRIVLDSGQVYLQMVTLPFMTAQERKNWVRWEGSQQVPFEPGTYQAVLLRWQDPEFLKDNQKRRAINAAELSAKRNETGETGLHDYLLIAIPLERIEALRQFSGFLQAELEEVTALGPKQMVLPVNLLPVSSGKEVILKRGYQAATVLCLLISVLLTVRGAISWQHARSTWLETDRQLVPFLPVKAAYEESKKTDYRIRQCQKMLQHIGQTEPVWAAALRTIGKTIPEDCWLEELKQRQTKSGRLEIKGCALSLTRVTEFLERLEQSGVFSEIRLVESGIKRIDFKNSGDNGEKTISFLMLAELVPVREEGTP